MRATAAPEEGNKVRLSVEVDETEVAKALDEVMGRLAREVRVPGFRPGKVPRRIIESRMGGAAALRGEALREALPEFYARALSDTEVDPIDQPEIDITAGEDSGPVTFDALVEIRPTVAIPGYQGLVVTLPSLEVPDEDITAQIDRLRATSGELVDVSRPVQTGDQVTLDIEGSRDDSDGPDDDLTAEDFLYEVGSGTVVPELDEHLVGAKEGDTLTFDATIGGPSAGTADEGTDEDDDEDDEDGDEETVEDEGQTISFDVTVKNVRELVLPEVTDEWASEASEFETAAELTADVTKRLRQMRIVQAQMALQRKAVEALVELVTEDVPERMVLVEQNERIHDLNHRLEHQGISLQQFLSVTGRDEQDLLDELRTGALEGVKSDLALRALVEAEGIELDDEELQAELVAMGERFEMSADQVREELERTGRLPAVRSDRRKAKALRWLLDNVELVDEEGRPVSRDELQADQGDDQGEEDSE